ncbi:hypothetical protein Moror_2778 [Moniliophthora roreri MCA 2997]|uniref:Uncharacterized protein n=1 Tax=Moniliophthora roreri (strain MCA 2997) TaxID=1381753 RepID=V2XET9_MONRO|nr:hypothetical protein Moror_2778 [Moniliophthora roreri MCA 2997]
MASASSSHVPSEIPQAVAVLLMIENSRGLFHLWSDLRDQYLKPLLQKIEYGHPSLPVTTFVLESLPPNSAQNRKPIVPRQYRTFQDSLQDVRFNHNASNRLSLSKIRNGAEYLANAVTGAVSRHIVILASSPPVNDASTVDDEGIPGHSPWNHLAELLTKVNARCHLILRSGQDMQLLTGLFEEMLRLQKITEENAWFPVDTNKIIVRLSSQRDYRGEYAPHLLTSPLQSSPPSAFLEPHDSLPFSESPRASPPQSPHEAFPSLVSQLQQVHGLTKKKVYGTKPVRKPFVSGELYRGEPTNRRSLSLSPDSPVSPPTNHGGRMASHSTLDRSNRLHHSSSSDFRPYHRPSRTYNSGSHNTVYDSSSQYRNLDSPGKFSQPLGWAVPTTNPLDASANRSPTSSDPKLPSPRQSVSLPPSIPSTPYLPAHSIQEHHHFHAQDPEPIHAAANHQGHPESVQSIPYYDPPIGTLNPPSSASGYSREDKGPLSLCWDPNLYRDELLSHLEPAHYRPQTEYASTSFLPPSKVQHSLPQENRTEGLAMPSHYDATHTHQGGWELGTEMNHRHYQASEGPSLEPHVSPPSGSDSSLTRWAG